MFSRHDLCDDHWERIRHLLPGQAGTVGWGTTPACS
jgi:transposase